MRNLLKQALVFAFIGTVTGVAIAWAGSVPYINPQQCQIPAACADMNGQIIPAINSNVVLNNGNALTVAQGQVGGGSALMVVDGVQALNTGTAGSGVAGGLGLNTTFGLAAISSYGSDTNVDLGLTTQGQGLVEYLDPDMWIEGASVTACPGMNAAMMSPATQDIATISQRATVSGYLMVKDYKGKIFYIPVCS